MQIPRTAILPGLILLPWSTRSPPSHPQQPPVNAWRCRNTSRHLSQSIRLEPVLMSRHSMRRGAVVPHSAQIPAQTVSMSTVDCVIMCHLVRHLGVRSDPPIAHVRHKDPALPGSEETAPEPVLHGT